MSAVNLLSSLREKSTSQSQKDGSHHEGHEDGGASSGGGGDPAVLALGPVRRALTYSRDELMRLRHSPLVKKGLEDAFVGCEALALVLKKRSDSPNEEDRGGRGDAPSENHKGVYGRERDRERRSADPRERVRKESEPSSGIVLSPQRRSFTSGCGAPAHAAPPPPPHLARTRPDSPLSNAPLAAKETAAQVARFERDPGGRRIGSGRIMMREEPPAERESRGGGGERGGRGERHTWERERDDEYRPEPYRPPPQQRLNGDRFERRSFGRDSYSSDIKREREDRFNNDKLRDREDNRRSGGRYSQRRFEKDDEPEWFSGGPTSQHDTIELCGFEEHESKKKMNKNGNANKETDKWNNSESSRSPAPERRRDTSSPAPTPNDSENCTNDKDSGVESKPEEPPQSNDNEFNLDDFLKLDAIPDVLTNGSGETEGSSRFSQWFRRESPTNDLHYERILHNMVDELDNSTRAEPPAASEPPHVFAPISPARPQPPSLMDLLLRANEPRPQDAGGSAGKVHSLEELESRLRPQQPHHTVPDHDLTAFKRLLAQVSGGHAVTAEPARAPPPPQPQPHQPMSLLQMLNKSMEQQHQKAQQQQQQQQQPPVIPPDLVYKLLHVQQRQQQTEQMNAHLGPERELLQRPEAQAILHGLKSGEITAQHLMQQLGNPGLQSRHREMLITILRMQQQQLQHHQRQMQSEGSPLPPGGAPPHLVVPPHHQPLRLSPLPHQAFCVSPIMATSPNLSVHHPGGPPRIPSPRELAVHTQSIMQSALIKKKLEEQRDNYNRRRQEIHHQKQATPISFTPTSVLRKMTAEKEVEAPSPKQQWSQPPKMPQMGRPIVKQGNQTGLPTMGYAPPQTDYQQHYLNQPQQQMINSIRPFQHPQQRQPQAPNNYNMNAMGRGMPGNSTLHQLLAQSHQRSLNEMGGVGAGGGDNQLARWFSPELLARASAGKLPSVHVPNALSLEDLERHHHSPAPIVRN